MEIFKLVGKLHSSLEGTKAIEMLRRNSNKYLEMTMASLSEDMLTLPFEKDVHVRQGPAANVGSRAWPVWRIARSDLDHWMHRRMGVPAFRSTPLRAAIIRERDRLDDSPSAEGAHRMEFLTERER
jgi:hypothetical protein